ncbi:MAG: hypothetical protein JSS87_14895 [Acidobacteria bacterium]|nr:hypothetical protein [Acidobacteriota bacterium]
MQSNRNVLRTSGKVIAALLVASTTLFAQRVEDYAMQVDSTERTCANLVDSGTWTTFANYMNGVGTTKTLAQVLTDLNQTAPQLTSANHPTVDGYIDGVQYSSGDVSTEIWAPQGLAEDKSGSINYHIVGWGMTNANSGSHTQEWPNGSRISVMNTTSTSNVTYRNVILVVPTGNQTYKAALYHAGGVAIWGHYLYVTQTTVGIHVFDLNNFKQIYGNTSYCQESDHFTGIFGNKGGNWCADGYGYMLPEVAMYSLSGSCAPKVDWLNQDLRPSTNLLITGEYCNNGSDTCRGDSTGLNGRMYQWQMGSDDKLITSGGKATPTKVYYMNERNVQGAAPDYLSGEPTDSYFLTSSRHNQSIFKVSPVATAHYTTNVLQHPEGIHATATTQHVWYVNEGTRNADNSLHTDPKDGGRVLIMIDQYAIN